MHLISYLLDHEMSSSCASKSGVCILCEHKITLAVHLSGFTSTTLLSLERLLSLWHDAPSCFSTSLTKGDKSPFAVRLWMFLVRLLQNGRLWIKSSKPLLRSCDSVRVFHEHRFPILTGWLKSPSLRPTFWLSEIEVLYWHERLKT